MTTAPAPAPAIDLPRFHAYLQTLVGDAAMSDPGLCYYTAASLKIGNLVGAITPVLRDMTTHQLILVELLQPVACGPVLRALVQSAILDTRFDLLTTAMDCGITSTQPWMTWGSRFKGTATDLLEGLGAIADPLDRSAAAVLATTTPRNQALISTDLLTWFAAPETARAFHCLLGRALTLPDGPTTAAWALAFFQTHLDLLFSVPRGTDAGIARLIQVSTLPPDTIKDLILPYQEACDDETRLVLGARYLAAGPRATGVVLLRQIRPLSLCYERAQALLQPAKEATA